MEKGHPFHAIQTIKTRQADLHHGACTGSLTAALLSMTPALGANAESAQNRTISIDAAGSGPSIDSTMYGAFYEDINQGADGGIYAELVQNRSFEFNSGDNRTYIPMTAWETLKRGSDGTVAVVNDSNRLNENNRNYLQIDATSAGAGSGAGVGVRNSGWNAGQKLEAHKKYNYSVWARTSNPVRLNPRRDAGDAGRHPPGHRHQSRSMVTAGPNTR
jgi:hypothetical protein